MTYTTWSDAVRRMFVDTTTDMDFAAIEPRMIEYAEGRIYREMDLLNTVVADATGSLTSGNRLFTFPQNYLVAEMVNVLLGGVRHQLTPVSKEFLNAAWPGPSPAGLPDYFAPLTDQTIMVGPWPDAPYGVEVVGTVIPAPLSAVNGTTFLTLNLGDLFFAATMIFGTGYKQNFGAQASDPAQAQSWETQYTKLFSSASLTEMRKRWAGPGNSSNAPEPLSKMSS